MRRTKTILISAALLFLLIAVLSPLPASATHDSQFVSQDVPTMMYTGEIRQVSMTFKNTGYYYWEPLGHTLKSYNPPLNYTWRVHEAFFGYYGLIAPGQEATFTFEITAPDGPGTYDLQWRIHHPVYGWFGESSPLTTIDVLLPNDAVCVSVDIPEDLRPGESSEVTCRFRNTGLSTWRASNNFSLRSLNQNWGVDQDLFASSDEVNFGQEKEFKFEITAPLLEGLYKFKWRMFKEGEGWFGEYPPNRDIFVLENESVFVGQSVPTTMEVGETLPVTVTYENTGDRTWSDSRGHQLGSQNPGSNTTWGLNGVRLVAGEKVGPGGRRTFGFNITAPSDPGTYDFQWQMVEDGSFWFGQKSPNVEITVLPPNRADFVSQVVPSLLLEGESAEVLITFRNSGTTTWTRSGKYKLGSQNPANNLTWGMSRVLLDGGDQIRTNETKTFRFDVTAPSDSGTYDFQWRMLQSGGGGWFGERTPSTPITVERNDAVFVGQSVPVLLEPGEIRPVTISFRNSGTRVWRSSGGHKLGSQNLSNNSTWGLNRVALSSGETVDEGETKTFAFNLTAPQTPGTYDFQWQMVQGAGWFGEKSPNVEVTVKGAPQITSLSSTRVPPNTTTTIEVTGSNLFVEDLYLPDFTTCDLASPEIIDVEEIEFGERLAVTIRSFSDECQRLLAFTNSEGSDARDFRVIGSGPVVDAYSPSKPVAGKLTHFVVIGANLQGASVSCTNPAVQVSHLDNSNDEALFGLLSVDSGATPSLDQLILSVGGFSKTLDVEIVGGLTPKHHQPSAGSGTYIQEFASTTLQSEQLAITRPCEFRFQRPVYRHNFAFALSLRDESGEVDPFAFDDLEEGELRNFSLRVLVASIDVSFSAIFDTCGRFQISACVSGTGAIEVLGLPGIVGTFSVCFPGPTVHGQYISTPQDPDFLLHSGEACLATSPVIRGVGQDFVERGIWVASVEAESCCPEEFPVLLDVQTNLFADTEFEISNFSLFNRILGRAHRFRCVPEIEHVVVIDPGHGGAVAVGGSSANNATGPAGTLEKNVALQIGLLLRDKIREKTTTVQVLMTRETDVNLSLADRAAVSANNDADAFISIHFNGNNNPAVQGSETYHHTLANAESENLADLVQFWLVGATGLNDRGVKDEGFGVLRPDRHDPNTAAVLAEISFLTDPVEEARLIDPLGFYKETIADFLAEAILIHLGVPR